MAEQLIENLSAASSTRRKYVDDYRANLMKIIRAKMKGKKLEMPRSPPSARARAVIDLMARLQGEPRAGQAARDARRTRRAHGAAKNADARQARDAPTARAHEGVLADARDHRHASSDRTTTGCSSRSTTAFAFSHPPTRGRVALVSRNGIDKTRQFPEVAEALAALHARVKHAVRARRRDRRDARRTPRRAFKRSRAACTSPTRRRSTRIRATSPAALMVFDLLLDGKSRSSPNRGACGASTSPRSSARREARGLASARRRRRRRSGDAAQGAPQHGWEGVIAKRSDAHYDAGRRTRDWLKLKIERRQEFVVGGWTEPRNSREHIGAILLGYYDERAR